MARLLFVVAVSSVSLLHVLPLDATEASAAEGTLGGEINVLLGVEPDDERGHVDNLLADANVALTDQDAGVMDGLGQSQLEHLGLEPPLQEILDLEAEDVIQLHLGLIQNANPDQTPEEGVSFEEAAGFLLVQGEELTGSLTDVGQDELHSPDLTLVAESELADQLQLLVEASLLEGTPGCGVGLTVNVRNTSVHHPELGVQS